MSQMNAFLENKRTVHKTTCVQHVCISTVPERLFFFFLDENNSKFESLALRRIFHLLQIKKKKIMTKNLTLIPGMGIRIS